MKHLVLSLALLLATLTTPAAEPFHYGSYWRSLTKEMKEQYVHGFKDGMAGALYHLKGRSFLATDPKDEKKLKETQSELEDLTSIHSEEPVLAEEVSDLYKDPANMYVPVSEMIVIAQAKIDGRVVDGMLLEQRKLVLESQKSQGGENKAAKK